MANRSKIEWTDATWNPITGCSITSPGCTNCYAMRMAWRMKHFEEAKYKNPADGPYFGTTEVVNGNPVWTGKVNFAVGAWKKPLGWKKPQRIFVNSMSDLFHEDVPDEWIDDVFAVMALCPQHTFQILTKRAERMRDYINGKRQHGMSKPLNDSLGNAVIDLGYQGPLEALHWPLPNVWLGVSAEDQKRADERIPLLLDTPAAVRFVSAEPLLGALDIAWALSANLARIAAGFLERGRFSPGLEKLRGLDWIIVGGESGPNARPMHPEWARSIRDQCVSASVPFMFKQWGEWAPNVAFTAAQECERGSLVPMLSGRNFGVKTFHAYPNNWSGLGKFDHMHCVGKKRAGRLLDGVLHDAYPEVLAHA